MRTSRLEIALSPPRILVVYYSRTGATRGVAYAIADELGCAIEAIVERTSGGGGLMRLKSSLDSTLRRTVALRPMRTDPNDYDVVVVGTPVSYASAAPAVLTYLAANRVRIRRVAFFCTYDCAGSARALRQMQAACGLTPMCTPSIRRDDVDRGAIAARVRTFASILREPAPMHASGAPGVGSAIVVA